MEFVRDYTMIADSFRRAGLNDQAAIYYQHQLLEQGHDTPQSWNSLGLLYEQEGKLDQAREAYERALGLNPDYADSHNNLGAMHLKAGEIEKAVRAFRKAHEIDVQAPQPLVNLGNAYLQVERFQDAASAFGKALQMGPDSAEVHHNLGYAFLESGRLDDALASVRQCVADPAAIPPALRTTRGTVFLRKGGFEEAGRAFEAAIQADSEFRPAYINRAMTHLRRNEIGKAEGVLRRLLKIESGRRHGPGSVGPGSNRLKSSARVAARPAPPVRLQERVPMFGG